MTIRIIQAGKVPSILYTASCLRCDCIFECAKEDLYHLDPRTIPCPTCKSSCSPDPIISQINNPKWTVVYNIVSPENGKWIGMGWEFFEKESDAQACSRRQEKLGNVPTTRPYHHTDRKQMGAAHR